VLDVVVPVVLVVLGLGLVSAEELPVPESVAELLLLPSELELELSWLDEPPDEAGLSVEDEAGLSVEDEAELSDEDEAELSDEDEAELSDEDEAELSDEDEAELSDEVCDDDESAGADDGAD
jgi:hypothetical protein